MLNPKPGDRVRHTVSGDTGTVEQSIRPPEGWHVVRRDDGALTGNLWHQDYMGPAAPRGWDKVEC